MSQSTISVLEHNEQNALLISPTADDYDILGRLFRRCGWALRYATSIRSASAQLNEYSASVVITERDLGMGDWRDVLALAQGFPEPPLVIVMSRQADDYLWAEALNLGAYDVLTKPLNDTEVFRGLTLAWAHQQKYPAA